jgi:hypothetical protein
MARREVNPPHRTPWRASTENTDPLDAGLYITVGKPYLLADDPLPGYTYPSPVVSPPVPAPKANTTGTPSAQSGCAHSGSGSLEFDMTVDFEMKLGVELPAAAVPEDVVGSLCTLPMPAAAPAPEMASPTSSRTAVSKTSFHARHDPRSKKPIDDKPSSGCFSDVDGQDDDAWMRMMITSGFQLPDEKRTCSLPARGSSDFFGNESWSLSAATPCETPASEVFCDKDIECESSPVVEPIDDDTLTSFGGLPGYSEHDHDARKPSSPAFSSTATAAVLDASSFCPSLPIDSGLASPVSSCALDAKASLGTFQVLSGSRLSRHLPLPTKTRTSFLKALPRWLSRFGGVHSRRSTAYL